MSRFAYIFGAGQMEEEPEIPRDALVIAADAGLLQLSKRGLRPDLIVGDFDSLGERPEGEGVLFHLPEKDDTDMLLAVREALRLGAETLVIYGGLGGRPDHEYANLQVLAFLIRYGAQGFLVGRGWVWTMLQNASMDFGPDMRGLISVFSHGGEAEGVSLRGLRFPLENHRLRADFPLGVSNEFTGRPARVSVKEGLLLLGWECSGPFDPRSFIIS